ncbi:MAG: Tryptophan-tRNA ligase [Candidatus Jorgensenbacteria bacterium GW2011_GWA2_45_9]|uniref:Tryptophan--tRNA ligase n=1 Tax=Candidatus Jorgensenbacteria bacterium GW2011_GWA2_45_9 TaxID=1618663 RepID=A0A0G1QD80_9BACT|nr:MAG: Tryptophan-tRNA ligase [Candidatus Jorgensenbacteria bacterium GW2011_GWA2_45_9]
MKPRLIAGIQPTGKLHIGNYLGALKNFVELQNSEKYDCLFFVADLHSLTDPLGWNKPKEKQKQIEDVVLSYLAAGLDPKKSVLFLQSDVPTHSELAWVLNTITPMGELFRMTQFKEKTETHAENTGLFTYPTLMAADILLYDAGFVPVGDDQLQHLELTRTLARKFNTRFGKTFTEPKPLLTEVPRLMSLDMPDKKMSKSRAEGCLFLDDSPNEIRNKIKRAVTDSENSVVYAPEKRPAISNLLLIFSALGGVKIKELESRYKNKGSAELTP